MSIGPWAILMTRITPKMRARPSATMAYSVPESKPEITTCPIIAGVMTMFIGQGTGARASPRPCPDAIPRELGFSADQSPDNRGTRRARLRHARAPTRFHVSLGSQPIRVLTTVAPAAPGLRHARAPTRFHVSLVSQPIRVLTIVTPAAPGLRHASAPPQFSRELVLSADQSPDSAGNKRPTAESRAA